MKTALITGCSRGIGLATALRLLEEGYRVIGTSVSARNPNVGHPKYRHIQLDLVCQEDIAKLAAQIGALGLHVDLLINNAGVGTDVGQSRPDPLSFAHTFDVNVSGLVMLTEVMLPLINNGGMILMLSSRMSLMPYIEANGPSYRMSKAAVNVYVKMLAQRLKERDIKVNALEPGWIRTDMGGSEAPGSPGDAAGFILHVIQSAEESGCFWQSSDRSRFYL